MGDNEVDLIEATMKAKGFEVARRYAYDIAEIASTYGEGDDITNTQITIRAWQVEITASKPRGGWWSPAQEMMLGDIEMYVTEHQASTEDV